MTVDQGSVVIGAAIAIAGVIVGFVCGRGRR